jgi:DNA-binding IclR family transcriptional regulator
MQETTEIALNQWAFLRRQEEWLLTEILRSRGVHRSTFKRMLSDTQKVIDKLEEQLFGKL